MTNCSFLEIFWIPYFLVKQLFKTNMRNNFEKNDNTFYLAVFLRILCGPYVYLQHISKLKYNSLHFHPFIIQSVLMPKFLNLLLFYAIILHTNLI